MQIKKDGTKKVERQFNFICKECSCEFIASESECIPTIEERVNMYCEKYNIHCVKIRCPTCNEVCTFET